jgi:hypothetical protein
MRVMVPVWFLTPFGKSGNATKNPLKIGREAEGPMLSAAQAFVTYHTKGFLTVGTIKHYGVVRRRDNGMASTSPDGVAPLFRNVESVITFQELAAVEGKCSTNDITEAKLAIRSGLAAFVECDAGTDEFRLHVPNPSHRTQSVHHACDLSLRKTMIIFGTRIQIVKIVIVRITESQANDWLSLLLYFDCEYMRDVLRNGALPRLGLDGSRVYAYAVEHYTLELYLRLYASFNADMVALGTPPTCKRMLPIMSSMWNKYMGGVDTVRRVLSGSESQYGSMSPCSLVWTIFFNYMYYNAYRVYQMAHMDVTNVKTYVQFCEKRKRVSNFSDFLYELATEINTGSLTDLRRDMLQIQRGAMSPLSSSVSPLASSTAASPGSQPGSESVYRKLIKFNSDHVLATLRRSGNHRYVRVCFICTYSIYRYTYSKALVQLLILYFISCTTAITYTLTNTNTNTIILILPTTVTRKYFHTRQILISDVHFAANRA